MTSARKEFPGSPVYLNVEVEAWDHDFIRRALKSGLNGLSLGWSSHITRADVQAIHTAGLRVAAWCIDDAATARQLRDWGVDYLMTNRPGAIRAQL